MIKIYSSLVGTHAASHYHNRKGVETSNTENIWKSEWEHLHGRKASVHAQQVERNELSRKPSSLATDRKGWDGFIPRRLCTIVYIEGPPSACLTCSCRHTCLVAIVLPLLKNEYSWLSFSIFALFWYICLWYSTVFDMQSFLVKNGEYYRILVSCSHAYSRSR